MFNLPGIYPPRLHSLGGIKIITDPLMVEQFRFPRSKGKRIKLKWKKRPANFRPAKHTLMDQQRGLVYCHPAVAEELRRQLRAV